MFQPHTHYQGKRPTWRQIPTNSIRKELRSFNPIRIYNSTITTYLILDSTCMTRLDRARYKFQQLQLQTKRLKQRLTKTLMHILRLQIQTCLHSSHQVVCQMSHPQRVTRHTSRHLLINHSQIQDRQLYRDLQVIITRLIIPMQHICPFQHQIFTLTRHSQ